jgi:hypothetical protein
MFMRKYLAGLLLLAAFGATQGQEKVEPAAAATTEKAELRDKAWGLLDDAARELRGLQVSDYRARWQAQLAGLLWRRDEKQARALWGNAVEDWKTLWRKAVEQPPDDAENAPDFHTYQQLRYEMARQWAQFDAPGALEFVGATRPLVEPYLDETGGAAHESSLLTAIAAQVARQDPKAALKLARESLDKGVRQEQINLLQQLKDLHRPSANEFARELYDKLKGADLLRNNTGAHYVAFNFLQFAHETLAKSGNGNEAPLSERDLRAYAASLVKTALSVSPDKFLPNAFSQEYYNAHALISSLANWSELEKYAPGRTAEIKARADAWQQAFNRQNPWQEYYQFIGEKPVPEALEKIAAAPPEMRDALYSQLANKAANEGNLAQAQQIIRDNIKNQSARDNILRGLEQIQLNQAISKGETAAARSAIARLRSRQERLQALLQLAEQLNGQGKKNEALATLDEIRQLLPPRPATQNQLYFYFALAQTYSQYDAKHSFEMLETLLEQFNELCAAAERVDGFLGQTYREGEFLPNGSLGEFAQQLAQSLANLANKDFDRARKCVTRVQRPEVRVAAALAIGQTIVGGDEKGETALLLVNTVSGSLRVSGRRVIIDR